MPSEVSETGSSSLPDNFDELPVAQQIELLEQLDLRLRRKLEERIAPSNCGVSIQSVVGGTWCARGLTHKS